jgi:hypothetical protein
MASKTRNKLPPFVAMTREMLNSKAYTELPPSAGKILPFFLDKVRVLYNSPSRYSTTFTFTYSEAKKLGYGKTTFYKILQALMKYGFIEPITKGGLRGFGLTKSSFTLSQRWEKYGRADFKEILWECYSKDQKQVSKVTPISLQSKPKEVICEIKETHLSLVAGKTC